MSILNSIEKAIFKNDTPEEKIKSSVPYKGYPTADRGAAWDGSGARKRIAAWAGGENKDDINWDKYKEGFAWYDSSNKENFGSYKLPHHDVINGSLKTVFAGVAAAAAAVRGARGGVDIPSSDLSAVRSHLAKHYKQFGEVPPWEKDKEAIEELSKDISSNGMHFFKDKNTGKLRWVAAWSSNYLDDDFPPDIISSQAQKEFIESVEKGVYPYPELRHWHVKGTRWGVADWLAYDEDFGISWATGTIDKGHELEALALLKSKEKIGVSHGMKNIQRDPHDDKVITRFETYEISDLPLRWAANKMTAMFMSENNSTEVNMTLKAEQRSYLSEVGLSDEEIEKLDKFGKEQADKFADRARKDSEQSDDEKAVDETTDSAEEQKDKIDEKEQDKNADTESEKAEGDNGEETDKPEAQKDSETDLTSEEVVGLVKDTFEANFKEFGEKVVDVLSKIDERLKAVEKANKEREEKEKEKMLEPFSVDLINKLSAVGAEETVVKDSDKERLDSPEESDEKEGTFDGVSNFSEFLEKNLFGN